MPYDIRYSLLLFFKIPINIYSTIDQKYYKFVSIFLYIISFLSFILFLYALRFILFPFLSFILFFYALRFILFPFLSFILFPLCFLLFPLYRFLDGFFFNYIMLFSTTCFHVWREDAKDPTRVMLSHP